MSKLILTGVLLSIALLVKHSHHCYEKSYNHCNIGDFTCNITDNNLPSCLSLTNQIVGTMCMTRNKQSGPVCKHKFVLLYLCSLLLAESYAPEPNRGPRTIKYLCAICSKAVRWNTSGVCCDSCDQWYHQICMGMSDVIYDALKNISWECCNCRLPTFLLVYSTQAYLKPRIPFHTLMNQMLNQK